jgi:hypothetical protein
MEMPSTILEIRGSKITKRADVITQHIAAQFGWTTKENVP